MKNARDHRLGFTSVTVWAFEAFLGVLLVLQFLLLSNSALAAGAGKSAANFLKIGAGGRGAAMGDAHTAAVDDVMSLYWNPGALGLLKQNEVGFMRSNYFQGIDQNVLYYAHPTATKGVFGAGLSMLSVGDITGYDDSGVRTGDLSASDTLLTFGWSRSWEGMPLLPGLYAGANLKFLQKKLAEDSATAPMMDLGLLYEAKEGLFQGLRTGFTLQNLGSGLNFAGESSPLPMTMKLGWAYPIFGDNLMAAADLVNPSDGKLHTNLGLDYRLWDVVAFRVGLKGVHDLDSGVTYGMRLGNERLHMDYAFAPFGSLGDAHRVSLGFRFGKAYRQEQVQSQVKQAYERAEARYAQGYLVDAYMQAQSILDVAPWHKPSKSLMRRIEREFKDLEDQAKQEELEAEINRHYVKGEEYYQLDDLMAARREFQAILGLQPGHGGARTYLKRIDERFRSIVQSFYETAMRNFASGDYRGAKEYLEKVLVVEPGNSDARQQLVATEALLSEVEKQEESRARMEATKPLYQEALSFFQKKRYEDALRKFDEILAIDGGHPEAKRYRGHARDLVAKDYYEQSMAAARDGEYALAKEHVDKALRMKPEFPEARQLLERIVPHIDEGNRERAKNLYQSGLEAFLAGDQDKALELWSQCVQVDPSSTECKRGKERIEQKRGQPQ